MHHASARENANNPQAAHRQDRLCARIKREYNPFCWLSHHQQQIDWLDDFMLVINSSARHRKNCRLRSHARLTVGCALKNHQTRSLNAILLFELMSIKIIVHHHHIARLNVIQSKTILSEVDASDVIVWSRNDQSQWPCQWLCWYRLNKTTGDICKSKVKKKCEWRLPFR